MEKKSSLYKTLLVISLILLVPTAVVSVQNVIGSAGDDIFLRFSGVLSILAAIVGIYYIATGFKKEHANAFKIYMACYVLSLLTSLISAGSYGTELLPLILTSIMFGLALVLFLGKDLGKRNSQIYCSIIVILAIGLFLQVLISHMFVANGGDAYGTMLAIRQSSNLVLSLVLAVMMYAKYVDKTSRDRE